MTGLAWALGRCQPISRRRDPSTDEGTTAAAPKANTVTTMATKTKMASASGIIRTLYESHISNLDLDNSANHKISHRLQCDASDDQGVSYRVGEKRLDKAPVKDKHYGHHRGRQSHEQHHGEASLGGVNADLAQNLEAFADYIGQVVKNLGQIAAGFALQHHCRHEELEVDQRHTVGQIEQGVAHREAEFLFFIKLAEFSGNRFRDLVGNHFECGGKCVAGAHGAGERVDGLGKLLLKFLEALGPHVRGIGVGDKKPEQGAGPAEQHRAAGDESDHAEYHGRHGAQHEEVPGANIHVSLRQHFLQNRDALRAAQQSVESRYPAEHFIAQQRHVWRSLFGGLLNRGEALAENPGLGLALIK